MKISGLIFLTVGFVICAVELSVANENVEEQENTRQGKQLLSDPKSRAIRFISKSPVRSRQQYRVVPQHPKPILRRRYQSSQPISIGPGYHHRHSSKTLQPLSPNYPAKKIPIQHYRQHKVAINSAGNKRYPNYKNLSPNFQQNYFLGSNSYSNLNKKPIVSPLKTSALPTKKFHPSQQYNGNVIMRPSPENIDSSSSTLDFQSAASTNSDSYAQQAVNDYKKFNPTKIYPPSSSYSVYDDIADDITQKPVKYHVYSNGYKPTPKQQHQYQSSSGFLDPIQQQKQQLQQQQLSRVAQQQEEAEKYLNFMSSTDYFLPNKQPDYHNIHSVGSSNFGDRNNHVLQSQLATPSTTSTTTENLNYMNSRTDLNFGHKMKPRIHQKRYDTDRLEFTENDAIHSYTNNPHDYGFSESKKTHGKRYRSSIKAAAAPTTTTTTTTSTTSPVSEITRRQDSIPFNDEDRISQECEKKCVIEENSQQRQFSSRYEDEGDGVMDDETEDESGLNNRELECYESCLQAYSTE